MYLCLCINTSECTNNKICMTFINLNKIKIIATIPYVYKLQLLSMTYFYENKHVLLITFHVVAFSLILSMKSFSKKYTCSVT